MSLGRFTPSPWSEQNAAHAAQTTMICLSSHGPENSARPPDSELLELRDSRSKSAGRFGKVVTVGTEN